MESVQVILGKRKAGVLHLSPSSSKSPPASRLIIVNGALVANTKKCYRCLHPGCQKSYSKPSRLEEHERSHTGERPFICTACGNSYVRETHLHAHARSHKPETARPFVCDRPLCTKRFWTAQHLKVHQSSHDGIKPYKCPTENCQEEFPKHHLLRAHICAEHAPPGTKPYRCDHVDCLKSFNTNQHLRNHQKTHDSKRYTCVHFECLPSEGNLPSFFPTWSALQAHNRSSHPPTCLYPSCNGRTFSNHSNLRAHIKLHEQNEMETTDGLDSTDDTEKPVKKKRRGGDYGRDWICEMNDCGKDFKSKKALELHINVGHLGKRDFICHHADCRLTFGYKHLLQRHLSKSHCGLKSSKEDNLLDEDKDVTSKNVSFDIDAITGLSYSKWAKDNPNVFRCPFPNVEILIEEPLVVESNFQLHDCEYVFGRAYDLRRHLLAFHDMLVDKEIVDCWVRKKKKKELKAQGNSNLEEMNT